MNLKTKNFAIIIGLLFAYNAISDVKSRKIVYGVDNRIETYQAKDLHQSLAHSTAGLIDNNKLIKVKSHYILPPDSIDNDMGLCKDERFSTQPSSVICSGFLVAPDLLVTAGHCIINQEQCDSRSWIFDYKVDENSKRTNMMIPESSVYKCAKVLDAKLESLENDNRDYSLIRLDRVVKGRSSLIFRKASKIKTKDKVMVIGHPSGLPQKITLDASVFSNDKAGYFETNLDTFGGNSGSAVFNEKTLEVEGILVRGAMDYVKDSSAGCIRVNQVGEDITNRSDLGESVSRITDIPTLKNRDALFNAVKKNAIVEVVSLLKTMSSEIYYDDMNTVLHTAIENNSTAVIEYLVQKKELLNRQNANGETPLHLAAYLNNTFAIKALVKAGADPLIKDLFGVFPSQRTNYFSFSTRNILRAIEKQELVKRKSKF